MSGLAAATARFVADLGALCPEEPAGGPLAVAVSGGPDSMALLALAAAARPGGVIAATVDHGFRPEARVEAAAVAASAARHGVPHATLRIAADPPATGNRHDWARGERYRLLVEWARAGGAAALCTAHHADDQAETFLMRAARGTGLSGLAGVRAAIPDAAALYGAGGSHLPLPLVRPLLGWRRSELRAVAAMADLPFFDDPSNDDLRFERARVRAWLDRAPWFDAARVARTAAHLAEAAEEHGRIADLLWEERGRPAAAGEVVLEVAGLPRGLCRALLRRAVARVAGSDPARLESVENLLDALIAGGAATQAGVWGQASGMIWRFRPAPPRRSA